MTGDAANKLYKDLESKTFKCHIINKEIISQMSSLLCVPFSDHRLIVSIAHPQDYISPRSWSVSMTEDGVFAFPETLLQKLNWFTGDEIEWIDKDNGTFTLTKINGTASQKNVSRFNRRFSQKKRRKIQMGSNST